MKEPHPYSGLRCTECRRLFKDPRPFGRCPRCGGLMDTNFDEDLLAAHSKLELSQSEHSIWKFWMFLPVTTGATPVTAGEGDTPLRPVKSYSKHVFVKDETHNPTGTFKDRGASTAITSLSQLKVRRLVLASEGNAGCSFALYSQIAGIQCRVYVPTKSNPAKVQLTKKLGAELIQVPGTIADAGSHTAKASAETGQYNASTFVTPFRHDGKGTMALEICEQLGWQTPDYIVYPVGGGVGLVGMWKMFKILYNIAWTRNKPRIVAVQPSGCAPVVDAFNRGREDVEEWRNPRTIANGLKIPKPLAGKWILKSLRESKGIAIRVTDGEIQRTMHRLAKTDGLMIEPSSAAAFASVPKLYDSGSASRTDSLVVIATGSGLKTLEQYRYPHRPQR